LVKESLDSKLDISKAACLAFFAMSVLLCAQANVFAEDAPSQEAQLINDSLVKSAVAGIKNEKKESTKSVSKLSSSELVIKAWAASSKREYRQLTKIIVECL